MVATWWIVFFLQLQTQNTCIKFVALTTQPSVTENRTDMPGANSEKVV